MKILLDNYNTLFSTEASSIHQSLARAGVDVHLWENKGISAFEVFDRLEPDVYITGHLFLTEDILKRLSGDKCRLVLNVSGITENGANDLESIIEEMNIKIDFAFYNNDKPQGFKNIKLLQIMSGADIFIPSVASGRKIPYGVVSDNVFPTPQTVNVYHKISLTAEPLEEADVNWHIIDLNRCVALYDNMVLAGNNPDILCGQPFFDMTLKLNGKCIIDITEENQEMVSKHMEGLFPELPGEPEAAMQYIKSTILRKHTCLNRAERLMQNLGLKEAVDNLRKLQENIRKELQNPPH